MKPFEHALLQDIKPFGHALLQDIKPFEQILKQIHILTLICSLYSFLL